MRQLQTLCPNCLVMTSWTIENILAQVENDCLAECTCVKCRSKEMISFKVSTNSCEEITIKGYEILDVNHEQHETLKPPYLE